MLEAFVEYLAVVNQVPVANPTAVATEQVVTEFAALFAVVAAAVIADHEKLTGLVQPAVFVAAAEPWLVVACALSADWFECLSCQIDLQVTAVVAVAVSIPRHYFEDPTVADVQQQGCCVDSLIAAAAVVAAAVVAAAVAAAEGQEDYSAG